VCRLLIRLVSERARGAAGFVPLKRHVSRGFRERPNSAIRIGPGRRNRRRRITSKRQRNGQSHDSIPNFGELTRRSRSVSSILFAHRSRTRVRRLRFTV